MSDASLVSRHAAQILPLPNYATAVIVTPRRRWSFSIATPGPGVAVLLKRYIDPRPTAVPCSLTRASPNGKRID